jgi:predicted DNA-binding protein
MHVSTSEHTKKGGAMKVAKTKTISVRVPVTIHQRIEALVEARLAAGHDEESFSIIMRKIIKLGLIEMEVR